VAAGQASVNVVLTGTVVSGSGFYDPGANLSAPAVAFNHISATATGGIVVNSVSYTDPTHITLNINTTGVPVGNYAVTVTNPDGQIKASVGNILGVTVALPVTGTGLSAKLNSNLTVLLNWSTESEFNNRGFYMERNEGNDINGWQQIAFIAGAGNSGNRLNYSYTDNTISLGHNYLYRLRQVDLDNRFVFSNQVLVKVKNLQKDMLLLSSYPNPFSHSCSINFNLPTGGNMALRIFNTLGEEVAVPLKSYQLPGAYSISFDAKKYRLVPGVYYCTLLSGNEKVVVKMVLKD
jgi:hypothetical protein